MTDLKKGDLITVKHEDAAKSYQNAGNIDVVMIDVGGQPEGFNSMEALSKLQLNKVVKNDAHADLAEFGVNIGHFSLQQIKVETLAFENEGEVRVNGEHDVPYKKIKRVPLPEAFFFEADEAEAICNELNKVEREKFIRLQDAASKGVVMLDTIVKKGYV